ncbi:arginase [Paenibacillus aurantius]|uniref:Arginase n=1 Tax=Paenibacillus aurantius TaxID=2918900 RepID=A0AA96RG42_9BACL|nr:arginase [Paenibacillus aurantius]WNQ12131.1 arginase [Paenibacillus aurantius]
MPTRQTVSLLKAPFDLGAGTRGSCLGPEAILHAGLIERLEALGHTVLSEPSLPSPRKGVVFSNLPLLNLPQTVSFNRYLASAVHKAVAKGHFPLLLGGDHSLAIGSLAGLALNGRQPGVLWIDAHADLNTEATSPTGNIHGMSLAASLGFGHPHLTGLRPPSPKLDPARVVLVASRDLDPGEREFIRRTGIRCFTMQDIDRWGMGTVMEEAIATAGSGPDGIHLSFDVDSVDPSAAPGTGTVVPGGLTVREARMAMEMLQESGLVSSADFVEVNPLLDLRNQTAELAVDLIAALLGERLL